MTRRQRAKHKKHKKKKTFVSPSQTSYHGSVGHHAFEQAHPQFDTPSKPQSYSLPAVKLSSLPPKQFYDRHTHKHKDKHHHKRQHSEHEHNTMTHSSQSTPPIPSLLHHAPLASPSLPPHTTQHSSLKHTTPHEGKHTHHKKKKKHRHSRSDHHTLPQVAPPHSRSDHHTLPQVAPPHGEPSHVQPTSPAPNSETKTESDHADSHPEGFPPSSKRARITDPSVLPGKPLPIPTPQHPVLPVQPTQWTSPKVDPELSAVQPTDTLLPQTNLEAHLESAVAPLQPPPLQSSTTIGPSLLNPPPHRPQPQGT